MSTACDLFGEAQTVCARIRDAIKSELEKKEWTLEELAQYANNADPHILDKYKSDQLPPRHVLMAMLWALDLSLDKILPVPVSKLKPALRKYWIDEMKKRFLTVAGDGEVPQDEETRLPLFLHLELLDEVCVSSQADIEKSEQLHRQLSERLLAVGIQL